MVQFISLDDEKTREKEEVNLEHLGNKKISFVEWDGSFKEGKMV